MPSPTLSVHPITRAGRVLSADAVAATGGGDTFTNTGRELFIVNNAAGSGTVTVTETLQATLDGQSATSKTVAVGFGTIAVMGPFPVAAYNDVNGFMNITYSGVASVTVNVYLPAVN